MMTMRRSFLSVIALAVAVLCTTLDRANGIVIPKDLSPLNRREKEQNRPRLGVALLLTSNGKRLPLAMAIPGNGLAEQVVVGGFANFLQIYNLVITARILLSWFPQAQGVGVLQPVFAITDPYLNLFRGLIPPIFGLDLSPLLAFFALNAATTATAALGCEPDNEKPKHAFQYNNSRFLGRKSMPRFMFN